MNHHLSSAHVKHDGCFGAYRPCDISLCDLRGCASCVKGLHCLHEGYTTANSTTEEHKKGCKYTCAIFHVPLYIIIIVIIAHHYRCHSQP